MVHCPPRDSSWAAEAVRSRRSTLVLAARALLLVTVSAPLVARAKSEVRIPLDSIGSGGDPSIPSILAIDGRNVHNVGNIWLNVTNFGLIGSQPGTRQPWSEAPSAQWPAPSKTEYLWSAGLWVGALKDGEPHVTTSQFEMEFRPTRGPLGRMYQAREGDTGGVRAPALYQDDDRDGPIDEDPLDGLDNDGDGRIDEDFAAISNQMFVCEYNDTDPAIPLLYPDHTSLGLKVQQTSMAWDAGQRRDFIAFNYRITTKHVLGQVYVGFFADPDIGPPDLQARAFDDMAGFWEGDVELSARPTRKRVHVSLGYMWDADADGGASEGYIGFAFLGLERTGFGTNANNRRVHPLGLHNYCSFAGTTPFLLGGEPTNDAERYEILDGTAPGSLPTGQPRGPRSSRSPNDHRFIVSAGPFGSLSPGDTLGITAALVIGRGFEGLKEAAAQAQLAFDGAWTNCDRDPTTGVDGRETPHCGPEEAGRVYPIGGPDAARGERVVPCDSLCRDQPMPWWQYMRCAVTVPHSGCIWIDGDCDASTGVDGNECLIHWFSDVPPPPPNMRLIAQENRVDILFDNRSERTVDPVLDVVDFESYRIWRADDWSRPSGSDLDTGPEPSMWRLLAEYDVVGNGIGPDTGLESIRYVPDIPRHLIEFYREWDWAHPALRPPQLPGFTEAQLDTALALARGVRYYRWVDPPFIAPPSESDPPCQTDGDCAPIHVGSTATFRRCDSRGRCRTAAAPPRPGMHYFYSVTATDHRLQSRRGTLVAAGPGLEGDPQSNFRFIDPPTHALQPWQYGLADQEIYVVPNPATTRSMAPWTLHPNNADPTGVKIEFHHLPAAQGKITIFTVSGDMVKELPFDARSGNGTMPWNLVNRNGQDVTSGVYLYTVEANDPRFKRFTSKFVVVR